ncbi:class I SAM-dependent methyltransferase [Arthrobacter sp. zg-Y916]|uniref:Class I SAM-dependent methyltransferase n=2 Tax=Arthrobacter TaxID=1663 RepID=A0A9X1MAK5_9MICC|nr:MULTISPECIES: class I SAM-dependent methyltransferase [Arthrobacter]MCC3281458.1 class I SAM-dependent methyltransferase [Arthrobacter caoxuetaonis]MCC3296288.1 class I SAM-dependent methyltransferase [Arthrobacter caoxuetaonis]MCC9192364.1 class I SAM-dependent methyltransferase [Arthrobacter sp. zg-Y916]USQ56865.1 class I SAM-dependent methyltransferase [Arthrobacter caoxuetaonis]
MPQDTYSHGHHRSVVNAHATRTAEDSAAYLLPHLSAGMRMLDVGCGPGSITVDLAALVAPGQITGLDRSEEVLAQARQLAAERGADNTEFTPGNVYDLEFADDTFDVVHAHQVLQHLTDPVAALHEMRRVTRPGGIVAVRDADYRAMSWFPLVPELDEWMETYQRIARGNRAEPDAGRRLVSWALEAGFTEVEASSSNWLYATEERRRWHAGAWSQRVLHSAFADQALDLGLSREDLQRIADGWLRWGEAQDGWFLMPSGELLARA